MTERAIKTAVRNRDGFKCSKCGISNGEHVSKTGRQLEVHRLTPGSAYSIEGCKTLCRWCHGPEPRLPKGMGPKLPNGRIRMICGCTTQFTKAIAIRAARTGASKSDVIMEALQEFLPDELEESATFIEKEEEKPRKKR